MAGKVVCTAGIYLLKVDDVNTRTMCEFFSKLIITTLKRRDLRHSGVLNVNFEQTSHIVLVFPLLPLKK